MVRNRVQAGAQRYNDWFSETLVHTAVVFY